MKTKNKKIPTIHKILSWVFLWTAIFWWYHLYNKNKKQKTLKKKLQEKLKLLKCDILNIKNYLFKKNNK